MNVLNGYTKGTLTNNYLLSAAGGHVPLGNASGNVPLNNNTLNTDLFADKARTLPYFTIRSNSALPEDPNDSTKTIPEYIKIGTIDVPQKSWYRGSIMLIFHDYEAYRLNGDILMIQCTTNGLQVGSTPTIRWKTKHDKSTEHSIIISKINTNKYDLYFESTYSYLTFCVYYLTKEDGVFNFEVGLWSSIAPDPITARSTLLNVSSEALTLSPEFVRNLNDVTRDTFINGGFLATNTPYSNYFTGISLSNSELKYKYLFGFSSTGIPFVRYNNTTAWLPWKLLAFTSDISSSYVTLTTDLTITGLKTFESNSSTTGVSLILKNKGWAGSMQTAMDFYNGSSYKVPNARISTLMNGGGKAGGTLIFYTQTKHASTNPNPNGLVERFRIGDDNTSKFTGDLTVDGKVNDVTIKKLFVSDTGENQTTVYNTLDVGTDYVLASIRYAGGKQSVKDPWLANNYSAGVGFGGGDTKGALSLGMYAPNIKFAAADSNSGWWLLLTGTSLKSYNLDLFTTLTKANELLGNYLLRQRMTNPSHTTTEIGGIPFNVLALKAAGTPLYDDPEFFDGLNYVKVYNNILTSNVSITRIDDNLNSANSSGKILQISSTDGEINPGRGGFYLTLQSRRNAIFVQIFRAKIPIGYKVVNAENSMGAGYNTYWLTDLDGTGKWEWYCRVTLCGSSDSFNIGGHVYLSKTDTKVSDAVTWYLSYCNAFDLSKGNYDGLRTKLADSVGGYSVSDLVFHKTYTSLGSLSTNTSDWYKVATITDGSGSPCIFVIRTRAHSSAIFTVSKGYGDRGNITLLQYCDSTNANYAYITGVRLLPGGSVEIKLRTPKTNSSPYVDISISMYNADNVKPNSILTLSTSTLTPIDSKMFVDKAIVANTLQGNLDWSYLTGVPTSFAPSNHASSLVTNLSGYSKATSASDLATTDTLNVALGKLEYKADYAYDWITNVTATDTDEYINKWSEIVGFLDSVKEGTDILDEFVTRKTNQTITGVKTFDKDIWFASGNNDKYITFSSSTSPATAGTNSWRIGYIGSGSGNDNNLVLQSNKSTTDTWDSALSISNVYHVATFAGNIVAPKFVTTNGTSSLFVKGDGSLDSNTYATNTSLNSYLPLTGGTVTGLITLGADNYARTIRWANTDFDFATARAFMGSKGDWVLRATYVKDIDGNVLANEETADLRFNRNILKIGSHFALTSGNYTNYINETNFPGLKKTGTVTSITVTGANGLSGTGTITTTGTITLSNSGVRSVSIVGDKLRINTNGTNSDLTIPYATKSTLLTALDVRSDNILPNTYNKGLLYLFIANSTDNLNDGGSYHGVIHLRPYGTITDLTGAHTHLLAFSDNGRIYLRNAPAVNTSWNDWKKVAWVSEIPTKISQLTNDSGYLTSRGYIGTTSVQTSAASLNLTGISNINMSGYCILSKTESDEQTYGIKLIESNKIGYLQFGQFSGDTKVHSGRITGINGDTLDSLLIIANKTTISSDLTTQTLTTKDVVINAQNNNKFITFKYSLDNDKYAWRIGYLGLNEGNANYLAFESAKSDGSSWNSALRFELNTLIGVFGGDVLPTTTNTLSLGSSSLKWSNVYATTFHGALDGNATSATLASTVTVGTGSSDAYRPIVVHNGNSLYSAGDTTGKPRYNYSTGDIKAKSFTTDGGLFIGAVTSVSNISSAASTTSNLVITKAGLDITTSSLITLKLTSNWEALPDEYLHLNINNNGNKLIKLNGNNITLLNAGTYTLLFDGSNYNIVLTSYTTYGIATASKAGLVKPNSVITKPTINATTTTAGKYYHVLMSSDGNMFVNVPWSPGSYTLPLAANGTRGGIQIGYSESGTNYAVKLSSEKAYVTVPWTDTKVNQTAKSDNVAYHLLLGPNGHTSGNAGEAYYDSGVTLNPSTNTITANISGSSASCTGNAENANRIASTTTSTINSIIYNRTGNATKGNAAGNTWQIPNEFPNTNAMILRMNWNTAAYGHDIVASPNNNELWHRNYYSTNHKWAKILDTENFVNAYCGIYNITINSNNISIEHVSGKQLIPNINEIPIQGATRAYYMWTADETPSNYDELVFLILPKTTVLSGGGFYYYNLTAIVNLFGIYIICDSNDPSGLQGFASSNIPCRTIIFHL